MLVVKHTVYGCDYVGLGYARFDNEGDLEKFITDFKPVAKTLKENGKYFMYHNHDHEFKKFNGKPVLELLAENISPEMMGFTLDTYWVQVGGADPAAYIEKFSGRVPCIHLKDYAFDGDKKMAVVGEGNINFDRVFEKAETAGTKYMLVEQDNCNGEDPFDCVKRSYEYLKSRGF